MEQTLNKAQALPCPVCWLNGEVGRLDTLDEPGGKRAVRCTRCHWSAWQGEVPDPATSALAEDLDCCPTVDDRRARVVPEHLCQLIAQALRKAAADAQGWFIPPRLDERH